MSSFGHKELEYRGDSNDDVTPRLPKEVRDLITYNCTVKFSLRRTFAGLAGIHYIYILMHGIDREENACHNQKKKGRSSE